MARKELICHEILVTESVLDPSTDVVKWQQHSSLALTGLDEQSEKPDHINRLVLSNPSVYMIVPVVFFKLLFWPTNIQPYSILKVLEGGGWGSFALR